LANEHLGFWLRLYSETGSGLPLNHKTAVRETKRHRAMLELTVMGGSPSHLGPRKTDRKKPRQLVQPPVTVGASSPFGPVSHNKKAPQMGKGLPAGRVNASGVPNATTSWPSERMDPQERVWGTPTSGKNCPKSPVLARSLLFASELFGKASISAKPHTCGVECLTRQPSGKFERAAPSSAAPKGDEKWRTMSL